MLRPFTGASKREKQYQAHPAFGDRRDGVISARTYFYANEAKCDSHMETFLCCIEASGGASLFAGCPLARPAWADWRQVDMWRMCGRPDWSAHSWLSLCLGGPGGFAETWGDPAWGWGRQGSHRRDFGHTGVTPASSASTKNPVASRRGPPTPFLGTRCPVWTFGKAFYGLAAPSSVRGKSLVAHGCAEGCTVQGAGAGSSSMENSSAHSLEAEHLPRDVGSWEVTEAFMSCSLLKASRSQCPLPLLCILSNPPVMGKWGLHFLNTLRKGSE